ncbi:hypothetical protein [Cerasicoccus frondis]|uniref:hypothetical protein n=1 Tax=Cerasicoccus frondis TaxID=490090 RepID=UPI002852D1A5|nr:hypothetical protein [Cerasicoccus frondis]
MRPTSQPKRKAALLGVGLDNTDGHKRITKAEKFAVVGGSEETHDRMTETLIKTCEDLKRKGRELEDAAPKEVAELLHKNTPR